MPLHKVPHDTTNEQQYRKTGNRIWIERKEDKQEKQLWVVEPISNIDCDLFNCMLCRSIAHSLLPHFRTSKESAGKPKSRKYQTEFSLHTIAFPIFVAFLFSISFFRIECIKLVIIIAFHWKNVSSRVPMCNCHRQTSEKKKRRNHEVSRNCRQNKRKFSIYFVCTDGNSHRMRYFFNFELRDDSSTFEMRQRMNSIVSYWRTSTN